MANKTLLEDAVEDVALLKKAAEENAKNYLIEAMSPRIQQFISSHLGQEGLDAAAALDAQGQNGIETMATDGDAAGDDMYEIEDAKTESPDEPDMDVSDDSDDDEDDEKDDVHIDINTEEGQHHDMLYHDDDEYETTAKDEQVELTQEDVSKAFANALRNLQKEASNLTPGKMGEMEDPNEGDIGLGGKLEKDKQWAEVVPQKVKMHAKEALEKRVATLQKQLKQYQEAYEYLKKNVNEMHTFNAKLYYTTQLLQNNLSVKQKKSVVEALDRASNRDEAELIFKTLSESFKIAGVVTENTKRVNKGSQASRVAKPSATLKESVAQENEQVLDRMALLAGITS